MNAQNEIAIILIALWTNLEADAKLCNMSTASISV